MFLETEICISVNTIKVSKPNQRFVSLTGYHNEYFISNTFYIYIHYVYIYSFKHLKNTYNISIVECNISR